jgi:hypothetical protein
VLEALVPKPLKADNVTAAAVFRVVEQVQPTLLIDEADMLSDRKSVDHESVRVQLLSDIRDLFGQRGAERLSSSEITMELSMLEGRPWHDWGKGKPMTPNQLARQLAPFAIKPKTLRIGREPSKGYERSDFDDTFTRYLPR